MKAKKFLRAPVLWVILVFVGLYGIMTLFTGTNAYETVPTSQIVATINGTDKLKTVTLIDGEQTIRVEFVDGKRWQSTWVGDQSQDLVKRLDQRVADKSIESWKGENGNRSFATMFISTLLPLMLLGFLVFFMFRTMSGGRMGFGRSRAKQFNRDNPTSTFADVAGCEEALEELQEIREFLGEPAKFQALGAKIPKGVLLYGPPGTGKTLLARAVAGEANVPFFSISGSDFVEMFVGVGASRVRDLFEQAKAAAPAIIFIDEIDAVGRHRGAGMGGSHDEREQTLNQLLVEMDGFDMQGGVVLIAATNRPDVLDPALLRPGRFDRQIPVEAPDLKGRLKILQVHAQGKPFMPSVSLENVAKRTPGMTGADLANVLNEAALLTARMGLSQIGPEQVDEAIDRVIAGPQKRSRVMDERELLITAYHEGGHAVVAAAIPGNDPVQKVTILPRGRALGYTMIMPDEDKYSQTRGELLGKLAYMLGGRAAEELVFHDPTTGASNDIERATKTARAMVMEFGMTERLGAVRYGRNESEPFLGRDLGRTRDFSEETAALIDEEVGRLISAAHQEAFDVLVENRDVLDELVRQLFVKETLDKEQVAQIFTALKRRPPRDPWTGSDTRKPSDLPPITPPIKAPVVPEPSGPIWPQPGQPVTEPSVQPASGQFQPPVGHPVWPPSGQGSPPAHLGSASGGALPPGPHQSGGPQPGQQPGQLPQPGQSPVQPGQSPVQPGQPGQLGQPVQQPGQPVQPGQPGETGPNHE